MASLRFVHMVRNLLAATALLVLAGAGTAEAQQQLVLVEDGVSRAPIVLFEGAPPKTREAAEELALYIEKISGAEPKLIEGEPDPVPEHAIWVGYQPVLDELFPNVDFTFEHPEEILTVANEDHLVLAGRDKWDPELVNSPVGPADVVGFQFEYGTANAVYNFLQEQLDVRWLWPGELGIDVIAKETIALEPFSYRYHPQVRYRAGIMRFSDLMNGSQYGISGAWLRHQRLQLQSLRKQGEHATNRWWEKFHEKHPDYFALQPDGTRSGFPEPDKAKLCYSNPAVFDQMMRQIERDIEEKPWKTVFSVTPADSGSSGHCICEDCRAWDPPNGAKIMYRWEGIVQEYIATSDRYVKFANKVARELKKRYPDRDYLISLDPYGTWRPAPVREKPDDNVLISNVANILWGVGATDADGSSRAETYLKWAKISHQQMWRPNTGSPAGWRKGLPDVPFADVMEAFKFVIDNGCVGIKIDVAWEQWANQGPMYYLMGQMAWNADRDWRVLFDDYCKRGFGPASEEIKAYWLYLEETRNRKRAQELTHLETWNDAFFERAGALLDRADEKVESAPEKYAERIEFVRAGLKLTRLLMEVRRHMLKLHESGGQSEEARQRALAVWDQIKALSEANPIAVQWGTIRPGMGRQERVHPALLKEFRPDL